MCTAERGWSPGLCLGPPHRSCSPRGLCDLGGRKHSRPRRALPATVQKKPASHSPTGCTDCLHGAEALRLVGRCCTRAASAAHWACLERNAAHQISQPHSLNARDAPVATAEQERKSLLRPTNPRQVTKVPRQQLIANGRGTQSPASPSSVLAQCVLRYFLARPTGATRVDAHAAAQQRRAKPLGVTQHCSG